MLYLVMAALSITTVVLSMVNGCPGLPFYVLEFIINTAMILEVSIRFIAFGRVSDACPTMTLLLRLPTNSSLLRTPLLGLPSNATLSFCLAILGSPTYLLANHQLILSTLPTTSTPHQQFWKSWWNVVDLILTTFCVITLLVIFFSGCGNTSKEEELLDTMLLVVRNVVQFVRLAAVMRQ